MTRKWFQIHLLTALVLMILSSVLLGLNLWAVSQERTMWESGLPLFDWSRDAQYDGQLALHLPGVLLINLSLNVGFVALFGIGMEQALRRREIKNPDAQVTP
jgi:hypothetical protein